MLNAPGTIDSDYRGEIQIILINHNTLRPLTRLAPGEKLLATVRGEGGFGHTGTE